MQASTRRALPALFATLSAALAFTLAAPAPLFAQDAAKADSSASGSSDDKPKITEETPFVISPITVVNTMLHMVGVHAGDFLIDLGSGDGRIPITAAKEYGARGVGIDYDPNLVKRAINNARIAGVSDRVNFLEQDIFKSDFSQATVITMYLLPQYNAVLQPKLLALRPGTRIVSHDYGIGDWEPDGKEVIPVPDKPVGARKESVVYFWVVPANLTGHWKSNVVTMKGVATLEYDIQQKNQHFEGTAHINGRDWPIERPYVNGAYHSFRIGEGEDTLLFSGYFSNGRVQGQIVLPDNRSVRWRSLRQNDGKS